jgi:hypothetical protein
MLITEGYRRGTVDDHMMPKSMFVVVDGHFLPGRHHFVTR